jgi:hypothetical protein
MAGNGWQADNRDDWLFVSWWLYSGFARFALTELSDFCPRSLLIYT